MLDGLNDDARAILLLSPDTGLRPSEAANLLAESIKLNHAVPHLVIEPIDRKLKNSQSARTVPLVGVALEVMKLHPNGFPRYRDKADRLSATINKYLRSRKLLPTDDHSLYSCRHNFEAFGPGADMRRRIARPVSPKTEPQPPTAVSNAVPAGAVFTRPLQRVRPCASRAVHRRSRIRDVAHADPALCEAVDCVR